MDDSSSFAFYLFAFNRLYFQLQFRQFFRSKLVGAHYRNCNESPLALPRPSTPVPPAQGRSVSRRPFPDCRCIETGSVPVQTKLPTRFPPAKAGSTQKPTVLPGRGGMARPPGWRFSSIALSTSSVTSGIAWTKSRPHRPRCHQGRPRRQDLPLKASAPTPASNGSHLRRFRRKSV